MGLDADLDGRLAAIRDFVREIPFHRELGPRVARLEPGRPDEPVAEAEGVCCVERAEER